MGFQFLISEVREQKMLSWALGGLLIFISAFSWSPSRDVLQGVYVLAFFLPILFILLFRKPNFNEYGGWPTVIALIYAGFSTLSTLWGEPKDFGFFVLQWFVLATWLCGSCLAFSKHEVDIGKYLRWLVILGVLITISTFTYYFIFINAHSPMQQRLTGWRMVGWNVFRNSNEIGAMCGIITLLAFTIAVQSTSLKRTWLFYAFAIITGIGLVGSFSRGALLAFIIMSLIALAVVRPPIKVWLSLAIIAIVTISVILRTTDMLSYYEDGRGDIFGGRLIIWKEVMNRCRENIFIGIGMTKNTEINILNIGVYNHAHNAFLDCLYRTGSIGLILVLLHLINMLQKFSRDSRLLPLYLWLGYGCICSLVDGRCFFWEIGAKWFLYWIPAGLIVAMHTGSIRQIKNLTTPNK